MSRMRRLSTSARCSPPRNSHKPPTIKRHIRVCPHDTSYASPPPVLQCPTRPATRSPRQVHFTRCYIRPARHLGSPTPPSTLSATSPSPSLTLPPLTLPLPSNSIHFGLSPRRHSRKGCTSPPSLQVLNPPALPSVSSHSTSSPSTRNPAFPFPTSPAPILGNDRLIHQVYGIATASSLVPSSPTTFPTTPSGQSRGPTPPPAHPRARHSRLFPRPQVDYIHVLVFKSPARHCLDVARKADQFSFSGQRPQIMAPNAGVESGWRVFASKSTMNLNTSPLQLYSTQVGAW
ncbi:hypothetical protein R3P38DRAFT_302957 [Favolaschia claudopus]|uniref:Uncharacterized protein n=1 Tax=Favolaschia claudopus TaxID=2862362 RepID=A0AAV9ZN23_9AGAR